MPGLSTRAGFGTVLQSLQLISSALVRLVLASGFSETEEPERRSETPWKFMH